MALTPSGGHLVRRDVPHGKSASGVSPEYKDEAEKLVINTGRPVATVARELGVKEQTLGRWVLAHKARQDGGGQALGATERVELARLRKQVSELKMDRAFLKKRRSSSPRKPRIRTRSVRTDAGGEPFGLGPPPLDRRGQPGALGHLGVHARLEEHGPPVGGGGPAVPGRAVAREQLT